MAIGTTDLLLLALAGGAVYLLTKGKSEDAATKALRAQVAALMAAQNKSAADQQKASDLAAQAKAAGATDAAIFAALAQGMAALAKLVGQLGGGSSTGGGSSGSIQSCVALGTCTYDDYGSCYDGNGTYIPCYSDGRWNLTQADLEWAKMNA